MQPQKEQDDTKERERVDDDTDKLHVWKADFLITILSLSSVVKQIT